MSQTYNGAWIAHLMTPDHHLLNDCLKLHPWKTPTTTVFLLRPHTWSHAPSRSPFTKTLTWPNVSQFIPSTPGISNNGKSSAVAERRCMPLHDSVILQREMHILWLSCTIRIVLVLLVVENLIYLRNLFKCSLVHSRIVLWNVLKKQTLLFRCCKFEFHLG